MLIISVFLSLIPSPKISLGNLGELQSYNFGGRGRKVTTVELDPYTL
jgi:hypothetical protein